MKLKRFITPAVSAALLLAIASVQAQETGTSTNAPDYSTFAKFVADRNIFNPNRYPRSNKNYRPPTRTVSHSAPSFTLVGTMEYQKGMFAFFDGNNSDYRKVLETNGIIAGYTITDITLAGIQMKSPGTNAAVIKMKLGSQMRQEGDGWQLNNSSDSYTTATPTESTESSTENNSSSENTSNGSSAPVSDVLKKLMQQREQEMK